MSLLSIFTRKTSIARVAPAANTNKPKLVTKSRLAGAAGASLLALVTAEALLWEDLRTDAYKDVVGIWTVCIGETKGVKPGMKFTTDECRAKFANRIVEFETDMRKCLTAPDAMPAKTYGAFLIATYNIGGSNFCGSSMARKANAGDLQGACDALLAWNKAGKPLRVVRGLTNRRQAERKLCLGGVREAA